MATQLSAPVCDLVDPDDFPLERSDENSSWVVVGYRDGAGEPIPQGDNIPRWAVNETGNPYPSDTEGRVIIPQAVSVEDIPAPMILSGTEAQRPADGQYFGRIYEATDTGRRWKWTGTTWMQVGGPPTWVALTLESPWTDQDASGFGVAAYSMQDWKVTLRLFISGGSENNDDILLTVPLPEAARPEHRIPFTSYSSQGPVRFDVLANGTARLIDVASNPGASTVINNLGGVYTYPVPLV